MFVYIFENLGEVNVYFKTRDVGKVLIDFKGAEYNFLQS
jgi:hypothetical protein